MAGAWNETALLSLPAAPVRKRGRKPATEAWVVTAAIAGSRIERSPARLPIRGGGRRAKLVWCGLCISGWAMLWLLLVHGIDGSDDVGKNSDGGDLLWK